MLTPTSFRTAQHNFRIALCDSFNTPQAVQVLLEIIAKVNIYFTTRGREYNIEPVVTIAQWVTRMLKMFGLGEAGGSDIGGSSSIGWGQAGEDGSPADVSCSVVDFDQPS